MKGLPAEVRTRLRDAEAALSRELTSRPTVPSVAFAASVGGRIVQAGAHGWADRELRRPATADTPYSIASITKPITATALMILVERGLVDLDQPIDRYLGGACLRARVGDSSAATVRRVAGHTAGLPLHYHFFYSDEPDRPPPREETIRRYGNLVYVPGSRYVYSNLGYGLLDHVVTRVSGRPWEDFVRAEVLEPLGMTRSAVGLNGLEATAATRYGGDGVPYPDYDFDHPGGSAVFASASDLVRFGAFHLGPQDSGHRAILSASSRAAMQTPGQGPASGYGIGWILDSESGMVFHSGGMGGVSSLLLLIPERSLAVAAISNAISELPWLAVLRLVEALDPDLGARLMGRAGVLLRRSLPGPGRPGLSRAGSWTGQVDTYEGPDDIDVRIGPRGAVRVRLGDRPTVRPVVLSIEGADLVARWPGDLPTADCRRRPTELWLSLRRHSGGLMGTLMAMSEPAQEGGAPERRAGGALAHWVRLEPA